jgi:hypothetical protein
VVADTPDEMSAATDTDDGTDSNGRLAVLGIGGALSLCCLFGAPTAAAVAGGGAAGGAAAALGAGLVRVLVVAATVGLVGAVVRRRTADRPGDS